MKIIKNILRYEFGEFNFYGLNIDFIFVFIF